MPPRHGKSELCSKYLPAWYLGTFPQNRLMYGTYESDFATQWGRKVRNIINEHGWMFGISVSKDSSAAHRWDIQGTDGGMQAEGMGGAFTGKGANLLILDDIVKGSKAAASKVIRDSCWEWWKEDVYTRLEPGSAAVVIGTRWHEDDLIGRLIEAEQDGGDKWNYVRIPAIAELNDPIGRQIGQPLWPARYSLKNLEQKRRSMGEHSFGALFQQDPRPKSGGFFDVDKMGEPLQAIPAGLTNLVRAWDKAGTADNGDYTVGVLMGEKDGVFYILDVVRGQWAHGKRDDNIDLAASMDQAEYGSAVQVWFEQEPGSGGKQSAEISVTRLRGYRAHFETATGTKEARADQLASQMGVGNVRMIAGSWNRKYIEELRSFPYGKNDDQVDASSLAFNKLAKPRGRLLVG